jgi:uracil-DNA glycosylase family 4
VSAEQLATLTSDLIDCRLCPRLVEWREEVAATKRAAFSDQDYWGRPVPGFGDPEAQIAFVGLAPRAGLATQQASTAIDDGLELVNAWVTSAVRCAPPGNKPLPAERDNCSRWLEAELAALEHVAVYVCLGGFGYQAMWRHLAGTGVVLPRPRPTFGHGLEVPLERTTLLCSYHPSQQNTFTGRLTEDMLDGVMKRAVAIAAGAAATGSTPS